MATLLPTHDPKPIPPGDRAIKLPDDHYLHLDTPTGTAPTESWRHTGTLVAGSRVFGVEINAAGFYSGGFTRVSLSDVAKNIHYRECVPFPKIPGKWAEKDTEKRWYVELGDVRIDPLGSAAGSDAMSIRAKLVDTSKADTEVKFDLSINRYGPPFMVEGHGVVPYRKPFSVRTHSYHYSLTRLETTGTVSINDGRFIETFDVVGKTWMDHEYGKFGQDKERGVLWLRQDMQLDDGIHLSNVVVFAKDNPPGLNKPAKGHVTVQYPNGDTFFVESILTPEGRTWTDPGTGAVCFMQFHVQIPGFLADLRVDTLIDAQKLGIAPLPFETYDGVASVQGVFDGKHVRGTAWNEQNLNLDKSDGQAEGALRLA